MNFDLFIDWNDPTDKILQSTLIILATINQATTLTTREFDGTAMQSFKQGK